MIIDEHGWIYDDRRNLVGYMRHVQNQGLTTGSSSWSTVTITVEVLNGTVSKLEAMADLFDEPINNMPIHTNDPPRANQLKRAIKL